MANLVFHMDRLPTQCFDGPRHRDMIMDLRMRVFRALRNAFKPDQETANMALDVWECQIIYLAIRYRGMIEGDQNDDHFLGSVLMDIQPLLLHF